MKVVLMVLIPVFIGVVGQIFLKKGMLEVGHFNFSSLSPMAMLPQFIKAFANMWVFLGFIFYFISSLFWMIVLSKIQLSIAYPLLSTGYILILIASFIFFKEPVSAVRWLGVLIICLGVSLVAQS